MRLPGGIDTNRLNSLNGLVEQSGFSVDPLRWRSGIKGVPLTMHGLNGLLTFPGSGGSDVLVRNPIHPNSPASALRIAGGPRNRLFDSMATRGSIDTTGVKDITDQKPEASNEVLNLSLLASTAHALGLGEVGELGCGNCGMNGLGTLDLSFQGSLLPSLSASLPAIPNWVLYVGLGLLLFAHK